MFTEQALADFFKQSWRKKPTLFTNCVDTAKYPLSAQSLCSLTTNDLIESRLIDTQHQLTHGPFEWGDGEELLAEQSLLLVQCLEQHLESIGNLLDTDFSFLPRWQVDDVMASIGDSGSSCGAHFDHYDVFLVQHSGSKTWHLDAGEHVESDLREDVDVRLLNEFVPTISYQTHPGDVLYIPPGFGHHGICDNSSITLSVGIRNPTQVEFLADLSEYTIDNTELSTLESDLYTPGVGIPDAVFSNLQSQIERTVNSALYARWYGCYVTRLRNPDVLQPNHRSTISSGATIALPLASRITYAFSNQSTLLFINGEYSEIAVLDQDWVRTLAHIRTCQLPDNLDDTTLQVIQGLLELGSIEVGSIELSSIEPGLI